MCWKFGAITGKFWKARTITGKFWKAQSIDAFRPGGRFYPLRETEHLTIYNLHISNNIYGRWSEDFQILADALSQWPRLQKIELQGVWITDRDVWAY